VTTITDAQHVFDLYRGAVTISVLRTLCRLEVPEHLDEDARSIDEVAAAAGVRADVLARLLALVAEAGLVELDGTRAALTPSGMVLRRGSAMTMAPMLASAGALDAAAGLEDALVRGGSAFAHATGQSFWSWLAARPDAQRRFAENMAFQGRFLVEPWAERLAWPDDGVVVDVGGGTGELLRAVVGNRPRLRGVLVELAGVVDDARVEFDRAGLAGRCRAVAADFRRCVPVTGDVYVLARVLHDWEDEAALDILTALSAVAPRGARLVVIDALPECAARPIHAASDVAMLLLFDGRERTELELRTLLREAGWTWTSTTPGDITSAIEAIRT
jgi:hypothetical protein